MEKYVFVDVFVECFAQFGVRNSTFTFDLIERAKSLLLLIYFHSEYFTSKKMQLKFLFFTFFASALSSVSKLLNENEKLICF